MYSNKVLVTLLPYDSLFNDWRSIILRWPKVANHKSKFNQQQKQIRNQQEKIKIQQKQTKNQQKQMNYQQRKQTRSRKNSIMNEFLFAGSFAFVATWQYQQQKQMRYTNATSLTQ